MLQNYLIGLTQNDSLLQVPVILKALERTMSTADKAEAVAPLQTAVRMSETANKLLVDLGEMVRDVPDEIFGNEVLNGIPQTAQLASNLHKESDRMLLLTTNQLQHVKQLALGMKAQAASNSPDIMGYSYGIKRSSSVLGMIPSLRDGEDDLASNADCVGLSVNIDSTVLQLWEAPSYRFEDHGGLLISKNDGPSAIDMSQPLPRNGVRVPRMATLPKSVANDTEALYYICTLAGLCRWTGLRMW